MITTPRTRLTVEEFLALPETNRIVQLIEGEVIELASPTAEHQDAVLNVGVLLRSREKRLGGKAYIAPLDVLLEDGSVFQPDALWIAPNSSCAVVDGRVIGAPDLVIEILSPGSAKIDRGVKFRKYEQFGVREFWLISLEERLIQVWTRSDGRFQLLDAYGADETFQSPLLGEVAVGDIFPTFGRESA